MNQVCAEPSGLAKAIREWLQEHGLKDGDYRHGGCSFYTREEWAARGEDVGNDSALTVISEGELFHLWDRDACCDVEPLRSLRDRVERLGYYPMLGYSWSMHFYPIEA